MYNTVMNIYEELFQNELENKLINYDVTPVLIHIWLCRHIVILSKVVAMPWKCGHSSTTFCAKLVPDFWRSSSFDFALSEV